MKVLYIGYYKEKSDWGTQTINNILALEKAGVNVVCRSIELGGKECPPALAHLENKDIGDATHCIQHVFPEHMVGNGKVKNIGLLTNNFVEMGHSSWVEKLQVVDEVWVPTQYCWVEHLPEVIKQRAKVIPLAIDTEIYNRHYNPLNIKEVANDFKIYTFANPQDSNGLTWLLAAFHSEFDPTEPVSLIVRVEGHSQNGQQEAQAIDQLARHVKELLRLQKSVESHRKDVIIATPGLSQNNFCEIHQYCDQYVTTNTEFTFPKAEIDAFGFGNKPIVADRASITEYIGRDGSVPSIYQVVQSKGGMFGDTNNGRDYWIRPDEYHLKGRMRLAYDLWRKDPMGYKLQNKKDALKKLSEFSFENVGQKMKEALSV